MLANILLPFQFVLELTSAFKHLDYFVRWPDNHDIKQEAKQCQLAKGPGRYNSEARTDSDNQLRSMYVFRQHMQMLQPAHAHERLTYARLQGGTAGTAQRHGQTQSAERHVCIQTASPHARLTYARLQGGPAGTAQRPGACAAQEGRWALVGASHASILPQPACLHCC